MGNPIHPGQAARILLFQKKKLNLSQAVDLLGISHIQLLRFLNGTISVFPLLAERLEKTGNIRAVAWWDLQIKYNVLTKKPSANWSKMYKG